MIKDKNWDKALENSIIEHWKQQKINKFDPSVNKPVFSIDTPPPYVNTPIHLGHAATYVLMDMFARFRRMTGYNVLFPLGLDRNGLPIEMAAEKKFNIHLNDVSRQEFLKLCKQVLEESGMHSIDSFFRLGISFNSWNTGTALGEIYLTDSEDYRALTQQTFIDLWKKNLIYEGERVNNFCPGCRTTIADAEVDYADLPSVLYYVKFSDDVTIATTRPELICTCALIIFNPADERYKHLEGKTVVTPLFNKTIAVVEHPVAKMETGTGLDMVCSFGDQNDIRLFREQNIQPVIAIDYNGRMNENALFLKGLKIKEAREKTVEELRKQNCLVKEVKINHRIPICERSKHPIEFISMKEFYLKQIEFKEELRSIASELKFYAEKSRQILIDWIDSISIDWPISRRRYYGTEIPIWYCNRCSALLLPDKGTYVQPWRQNPEKACHCGSKDFTGEDRVFDTWFDSSNSPLYIMKYDQQFFTANTPCSLRPQGKEIIRTWLYYTLLKAKLLTNKKIFDSAWINYHVVDEKGIKMSKSLGNIIDPHEILEKYGAEPFRLWCVVEGDITKGDMKCSFQRIDGAGKTLTKLWNIARFVEQFKLQKIDIDLLETDRWILNTINEIIQAVRENYEKYDFHTSAALVKHFIWEIFASHYIELVKNRAYNQENRFSEQEKNAAIYTLHYCLQNILKLLAPVIPIFTYRLYMDLYEKDVHKETFPATSQTYEIKIKTEDIQNVNSKIWKEKKDEGLSLKAEIKELVLPENFKLLEKDMKITHNINKIQYGKNFEMISS